MSGLLALLDDVAGIAKVAAASVDDVLGQAVKASSKAAGAVIDDAAVTPKYLHGFAASRELPIIWRIARGSLINKLVFLTPVGLALSAFAPWAIAPLLMLGGAYLCFEGAEKIIHVFQPHAKGHDLAHEPGAKEAPAHLEEAKIKGAIKTDFILSAEIMTISLAAIPESTFWMEAATLATVAIIITTAVYGAVAVIVKMDDVGLHIAKESASTVMRGVGRTIVKAMPGVMKALTIIGTAAMLWVGGEIIVHGLAGLGWHGPEDLIKTLAYKLSGLVPDGIGGFSGWMTKAALNGLLGLCLGSALVPLGTRIVGPVWVRLFNR
jgi:predicted DNA repair protein MutK